MKKLKLISKTGFGTSGETYMGHPIVVGLSIGLTKEYNHDESNDKIVDTILELAYFDEVVADNIPGTNKVDISTKLLAPEDQKELISILIDPEKYQPELLYTCKEGDYTTINISRYSFKSNSALAFATFMVNNYVSLFSVLSKRKRDLIENINENTNQFINESYLIRPTFTIAEDVVQLRLFHSSLDSEDLIRYVDVACLLVDLANKSHDDNKVLPYEYNKFVDNYPSIKEILDLYNSKDNECIINN